MEEKVKIVTIEEDGVIAPVNIPVSEYVSLMDSLQSKCAVDRFGKVLLKESVDEFCKFKGIIVAY